jgi:hypothetical protein
MGDTNDQNIEERKNSSAFMRLGGQRCGSPIHDGFSAPQSPHWLISRTSILQSDAEVVGGVHLHHQAPAPLTTRLRWPSVGRCGPSRSTPMLMLPWRLLPRPSRSKWTRWSRCRCRSGIVDGVLVVPVPDVTLLHCTKVRGHLILRVTNGSPQSVDLVTLPMPGAQARLGADCGSGCQPHADPPVSRSRREALHAAAPAHCSPP